MIATNREKERYPALLLQQTEFHIWMATWEEIKMNRIISGKSIFDSIHRFN